jgi:hypothetical protein
VGAAAAGYRSDVSKFIMGLLAVQLLGGLYLLMFVADAGVAGSTARRTRIPDPVVFWHPFVGATAAVVWVAWLFTHGDPLPWVALGILVVGSALGGYMGALTHAPAPDPVEANPADPAAARLAEKRIPSVAMLAHGGLALVLMISVLLVALGVD